MISEKSVADVLRSAKEVIENSGWQTGQCVGFDGKVCSLGAIYLAEGVIRRTPDGPQPFEYVDHSHNYAPDFPETPAVVSLAKAIDRLDEPGRSVPGAVWHYNDFVANTKEQVLAMFDKAIEAESAQNV